MRRNATEAFLQHLSFVMEELPSRPKRAKDMYKFTPSYFCLASAALEVLGCSYETATCVCLCRICKLKDWRLEKDSILAVSAEDYDKWAWAESRASVELLAKEMP